MEEEKNLSIVNESNPTGEEVESPPQQTVINADTDTTAGAGARSFECIFCKRGLSTAQALGGHMNIHRRERSRVAKINSTLAAASSASSKRSDCNVAGYYHPYLVHKLQPSMSSGFGSPTVPSDNIPRSGYGQPVNFVKENHHHHRPRELNLFYHDQESKLGLGLVHGYDLCKRLEGGEEKKGGGEETLDLELRLGWILHNQIQSTRDLAM